MNESKPVDLEAIRAKMPRQIKLGIGADIEDANALCDEVESLRARVKELEEIGDHYQFKWATLKEWLIRDKENGSGHKVSRALRLMAELEKPEPTKGDSHEH
jgi:hypothetical protein